MGKKRNQYTKEFKKDINTALTLLPGFNHNPRAGPISKDTELNIPHKKAEVPSDNPI